MPPLTSVTEIEANQTGRMTDAQREALIDRYDVMLPIFVLSLPFMVLGAGFAAALLVGGVSDLLGTAEDASSAPLICLFMIALLFAAILVFQIAEFFKRIITIPRVNRLSARSIVSSPGQIAWGRKRYEARTEGRRLKSIYDPPDLPSPGLYTFYHLHGTKWLLAAASVSGTEMENQNILQEALARANNFRIGALPANRQGRFGMGQRGIVLRQTLGAFSSLLGVLLTVVIVVGFGVIYVSSTNEEFTWHTLGAEASVSSLVLLLCGGLLILGFIMAVMGTSRTFFGLIFDMLLGRVRTAEGQVTRFRDTSGDSEGPSYEHFYYRIDALQFRVSKKAYEALVPGEEYRVYYVPTLIRYGEGQNRRLLINIEPLNRSGQTPLV